MDPRLSRDRVQAISEDLDNLQAMGFTIEQGEEGMTVTYPEGASRIPISRREGLSIVFFIYHYEQRQMSEQYDPQTGGYRLTLKPARFAQ